MEQRPFDLIVIGSGAAGREAARLAAGEHGASVAVVERGRWSGECATVACKPTKQYVAAAELLHDLRAAGADLGIETGKIRFRLAALEARKDWLVGPPESWRARFDLPGVTTVDGDAELVDARTVRVDDVELGAERVLVATGSRTAVPPIEGVEDVPWLDNAAALELTEVPESLLVIGAGAVGLELGQVFSRFGARVTIVETLDGIGGRADAEVARSLQDALEAEGIEVLTGTLVSSLSYENGAVVALLTPREGGEPRELRAARLLLAAGRAPNVEGLGLERVGVETVRQGIVVDARQRTSAPGIWAAGDVAAGIQLTPVAAYQGQVAVADMFGGSTRAAEYRHVPSAVFTDPELAGVGLTEEQAIEAGFDTVTAVHRAAGLIRPYYTLPRDAAPHGLVKLVYDRASRRLLGVHATVRGGAELVQGFAVALGLGATVDDVALGHYAFPTVGEAVHYAAESALGGALVGA
jgi:mercuric reductase